MIKNKWLDEQEKSVLEFDFGVFKIQRVEGLPIGSYILEIQFYVADKKHSCYKIGSTYDLNYAKNIAEIWADAFEKVYELGVKKSK
jgi:hypothetical protein